MDSHLVAVEVRVKGGANQRMDLNSSAVNQDDFKCLDTEAVQGRSAVEKDGSFFDHFFQNVIDFRFRPFHLTASALDIMGQPLFDQAAHDKWFEQFQCHPARQTALVQLKFRPDDDNGTAAVINTFAEQVLAETSLFAA